MTSKWRIRLGGAIAAVMLLASTADAQVVLRGRGRGIVIDVPGVGIQIGPVGIPNLGYGIPRRLGIISPLGIEPGFGEPYPRPAPAALPLPTEGELRAMDDSSLLNAVVGLATRLDADLGRFTSAASWRNYLRLPDDALPPPSDDGRVALGMNSLMQTLARFESAVANPTYVQISGLPSFAAMHAALEETVRRFAGESTPAVVVNQSSAPITPPIPSPDSAAASPAPAGGYGESIEMRNLRAGRPQAAVTAKPAATAEELPVPPPSLVAPKNSTDEEQSILAD